MPARTRSSSARMDSSIGVSGSKRCRNSTSMRSVCRRLQARLDRAHDVAARAAARIDVGAGRVEALGGDHEIVAVALGQPAEDLLGLALVVLVGAVEEVDAGVAHRLVHAPRTWPRRHRRRRTWCRSRVRRRRCRYGRGACVSSPESITRSGAGGQAKIGPQRRVRPGRSRSVEAGSRSGPGRERAAGPARPTSRRVRRRRETAGPRHRLRRGTRNRERRRRHPAAR